MAVDPGQRSEAVGRVDDLVELVEQAARAHERRERHAHGVGGQDGQRGPAPAHPPRDADDDVRAERDREAEILAGSGTWALLALADGAPVGHASFTPARERRAGERRAAWQTRALVPGLAHLRQLFVLPDWWGTGVAPLLHDAAVAEMRAQGYDAGRLFTPSQHARARRFYERRGWVSVAEAWNEELGLPLAEYRLVLED